MFVILKVYHVFVRLTVVAIIDTARCVGVETSLKLQGFVYTIQTLPILGRVDLAAVFFDASKWRDEHLLFGTCAVFRVVCWECAAAAAAVVSL